MANEKLTVELRYRACALGRLICIYGGDLDYRRKLRVRELVVSALTLLTLRGLFHGLHIYRYSELVWYCFSRNKLPYSFCILENNFVQYATPVKATLGCVA